MSSIQRVLALAVFALLLLAPLALAVSIPGEICDNGVDDDADTFIDCADPECAANPACTDADADGIMDASDNCMSTANLDQANPDGDSYGSACDNCANLVNDDQADADADHFGDACDNCPTVANADQADDDHDAIGNACDAYNCVPTGPEVCGDSLDNDCDGTIDNCIVGTISVELVSPPANVTQNTPFNFTTTVTCTGGDCGDVTLILDPTANEQVYSESFTQYVSSDESGPQCVAWEDFRDSLTGTYDKITIRGTQDMTGLSCLGATADDICHALQNREAGSWSCDGHTWNIGGCGYSTNGEINVDGGMCSCLFGAPTVRPCIGNSNWGGVNSQTCDGVDQTLEVICTNTAKGVIPMESAWIDEPFYTTTQNPMGVVDDACLDMEDGDSCTITWSVMPKGNHLSLHEFFVIANWTNQGENGIESDSTMIRIVDLDADDDTINDDVDNCVDVANLDQANADADAFGDVCDNCVDAANDGQQDVDDDAIGDACDTEDWCGGAYGACDCGDLVVEDYTLTADMDCSLEVLKTVGPEPGDALIVGTEGIIIDCAEYSIIGTDGKGIYVPGYDDALVKNCDIYGFDVGVYADGDTFSLTVENSEVHDNEYGGINGFADTEGEITVRNCVIHDNGYDDCYYDDTGSAVRLQGTDNTVSVIRATIEDSTIYYNDGNSLMIGWSEDYPTAKEAYVTVIGNDLNNSGASGTIFKLNAFDYLEVDVRDNTIFQDNCADKIGFTWSDDGVVENANISFVGNTFEYDYYGLKMVALDTMRIDFVNNTLNDTGSFRYGWCDSFNNPTDNITGTWSGNTLYSTSGGGIVLLVDETLDVDISDNDLYDIGGSNRDAIELFAPTVNADIYRNLISGYASNAIDVRSGEWVSDFKSLVEATGASCEERRVKSELVASTGGADAVTAENHESEELSYGYGTVNIYENTINGGIEDEKLLFVVTNNGIAVESFYEDGVVNIYNNTIVDAYYGILISDLIGGTLTGNDVSNSTKGIYFENDVNTTVVGGIYHGNCEGAYVSASSEVFFDGVEFSENHCEVPMTGLYITYDSTAHVIDGIFTANGEYGIYDEGPSFLFWSLLTDAYCTNNSVRGYGWIIPKGGDLWRENCAVQVIGTETYNSEEFVDDQTGYAELPVEYISSDPTLTRGTLEGEYLAGGEGYFFSASFENATPPVGLFDKALDVLLVRYYNEDIWTGLNAPSNPLRNWYAIEPMDGFLFDAASYTFWYADRELEAGLLDEATLVVYGLDENNTWVALPSTVDSAANSVEADVGTYSQFGIYGDLACGNGKLDYAESCDGGNFNGKTCADYDFRAGDLSCSATCTIVTTDCSNGGGRGGGGGGSGCWSGYHLEDGVCVRNEPPPSSQGPTEGGTSGSQGSGVTECADGYVRKDGACVKVEQQQAPVEENVAPVGPAPVEQPTAENLVTGAVTGGGLGGWFWLWIALAILAALFVGFWLWNRKK